MIFDGGIIDVLKMVLMASPILALLFLVWILIGDVIKNVILWVISIFSLNSK